MAGNDTIDGMGGDDSVLRGDGGGNANDALISRDGVSGNDSLDGGSGTGTRTTDSSEKSIVGFP